MRRRGSLALFWAGLFLLLPAMVHAVDEPVLVVLPFEVHAATDRSSLGLKIPEMVRKHVISAGVVVVDATVALRALSLMPPAHYDEKAARRVAEFVEADYVLFGSLSIVGGAVSLDATLIAVDGSQPSTVLFERGKTLDALPGMVAEMSKKVATYVFGKQRVVAMDVVGNKRIEKEAVLAVVKTRKGALFSLDTTNKDIRAIYDMGYFEDVRVRTEQLPDGIKVIYEVKENPTIVEVKFVGLDAVKESDAQDAFNIKPYSILNEGKIKEGIESLEELYKKDGYLRAKVTYSIEPVKEGQVVVVVKVKEGRKIYIREISFMGNKAFDADTLKDQMETSEKGLLFWLFRTGKLEMPKLENDVENLASFYQNHGYLRVKVGRPEIKIKEDGVYITIPIQEGPQYRFGRVRLEGDFIEPKEKMYSLLSCKEGEVYSRELVRKDLLRLRELYNNKGYAYPDITPVQDTDDHRLLVNLTYRLKKNQLVRFERINITGNIKTRDKVIRRELKVYEQGLFSAKGLQESMRNLHRLDFFENIDINTSKGSSDDKMILDVEVTEKKTGNLSVGAGFSSNEGVVASFEIQERNFLGYGQRLAFTGQIGGKTTQFSLSYTEPWLFDIPLSTTLSLYNLERDYDDFTKKSWGGSLRASYPIWDKWDLRIWGSYRYESADVTDVNENASVVIQDQEGHHTTSAVTVGLRRDTRNRLFLTTDGSDNWVSVEYAGGPLGGSAGFVKYLANSAWYFPFWKGTSFFTRGRIGYIQRIEGEELLLYEKFFLGGINTIRGFQVRKVSPKDPITGDRIGGDKFVFMNFEFRFPIIAKASIFGVAFFDVGNVYPDNESYDFTNLRRAVGAGIRWYSPLGPLRLEWGYNLAPEPDESRTVWDFTVGYGF